MEILKAVTSAKSCCEAVHNLYRLKKAGDPKHSLAFICRKAKLPSRAFFSDIIYERRKLPVSYVDRLAEAFGLEGLGVELLRALARRDLARSGVKRAELDRQARILRNAVEAIHTPKETLSITMFEVYCAMSALAKPVKPQDLRRILPRVGPSQVEESMAALAKSGLLSKSRDRYALTKDLVVFVDDQEGMRSLIEFIRASLEDARLRVTDWFPRKEAAHFQSMIFNVSESGLKRFLPVLRGALSGLNDQLLKDPGDVLIHFNVQLFPTANSRMRPSS